MLCKHMQDPIFETSEIPKSVSVALKYLYFVVAAFRKAVCIAVVKGIGHTKSAEDIFNHRDAALRRYIFIQYSILIYYTNYKFFI